MKKILILVVLSLLSVMLFTGCGAVAETVTETVSGTDAPLTKAMFDSIENGMTYEQVVEIIGTEGEMLSEVGKKGDKIHTVVYMWYGKGGIGANANFTFQGGKLLMKAQVGLK